MEFSKRPKQNYSLIVTTHSSEPIGHHYPGKGRTTPEILWQFIQNFPEITIVCAHWGGGLPFYALMPEVASTFNNVYFDTAASPLLYDTNIYPTVTSLVGANRILLGSDFPLLRPRRIIKQINGAPLSGNEKLEISGKNALSILNR